MTNLKRVRMERRITQRDLAKRTKLWQPMISDFENGKLHPGPEIAARLAKVLGVPADWILER